MVSTKNYLGGLLGFTFGVYIATTMLDSLWPRKYLKANWERKRVLQ